MSPKTEPRRQSDRRVSRYFRRLWLEPLERRLPLAMAPSLVLDIHTAPGAPLPELDLSVPPVVVGSVAFFAASGGELGVELWKTDGTVSGTVLVKDIRKGFGSSFPSNLTNVNGTLFFQANDGASGYELWKSDGTAEGTVLVKDIWPGSSGSFPRELANVNGTLFFAASGPTIGQELWKSDGTAGGTVLVKDIRPGGLSSLPYWLRNVSGTLFFTANDGANGVELWKSDGTAGGTVLVKDITPGSGPSQGPTDLTNVGGTLFFSANDGTTGYELWKSDGTAGGTVLVKDIHPQAGGRVNRYLTNVSGKLFFVANDGANGYELWTSDGTADGTILVKDVWPGAANSGARHLTNVNGALFFAANDGTTGSELWTSDGTAAGTVLVKDIVGGSVSSVPVNLTNVDGVLFFSASDIASGGSELWKSNGTESGTVLVKDVRPGIQSSFPNRLVNLNGRLLFGANDGTLNNGLWSSDGTGAGTLRLSRPATVPSNPSHLEAVGNVLYFAAQSAGSGRELWKSDGTANGTVMLRDIRPGAESSDPALLTNVSGTLFFTANDGNSGYELWKTDGASAGTVLVKDLRAGSEPTTSFYGPSELTNVGGKLYFAANDGTNGEELWISDGTAGGTVMVKEIRPGAASARPRRLTNVGGTLFFLADDGVSGSELWKSDGTAAGTVLVKDIRSGSESSQADFLVNANGVLYFVANDGVSGYELWKSDGTAGGTVLVKDIRPGPEGSAPWYLVNVNGVVFFQANDGTTGYELWRSDGTAGGTVLVSDIRPGGASSDPGALANVDGTLFFLANDGIHGRELWKSDGTAGGTVLVKDIRPGAGSIEGYPLVNAEGLLLFVANDGQHGFELWRSDGTAAGTAMLADIAAGVASSVDGLSFEIHTVGGRLLFAATDLVHGRELWSLVPFDFGDGPASFGTSLADDGARHFAIGPTLGLLRDEEPDGLSSALADADDAAGRDEDGLLSATLVRGKTSSVTVEIVAPTGPARLDAWIDFDASGAFSADEKVSDSRAVASGISQISFPVPPTARLGPTTMRLRLSSTGGLGPTGIALDGEVEDHVVTIVQDLAVELAAEQGARRVLMRRSGDNVEVVDAGGGVLVVSPVVYTRSATIRGAAGLADEFTIDFASGGFFSLPLGIELDGGIGGPDALIIQGTPAMLAECRFGGQLLGTGALQAHENGLAGEIRFTNFEPLTIGGFSTLEVHGPLHVGGQTLTAAGPRVRLGALTLLAGGVIDAPAGVTLPAGRVLRGSGAIRGPIAADVGSLIEATGHLTLGDAASPAGFLTRGELKVGASTVTLLDANQAVLGSLTALGAGGMPGTLVSANGAIVDFGSNVAGYGTIDTPNSATQPLINNGSILGDSVAQPITLPGYVRGVGSLDNVILGGTHSPGFSPAVVYHGTVTYDPASVLVMELGGTAPGSGYDQQVYSGTAALAGTLDIELIGGFEPVGGEMFMLLTGSGGFSGAFGTVNLPPAPGRKLLLTSSDTSVTLTVIDINDPPTFELPPNPHQTVTDEQTGGVVVNGFVRNMAVGPANEAAQSLVRFNVIAADPSLFLVQPTIALSGQLTFTPAPNVAGTTTVTVTLTDDGGIDHDGRDTSVPQVFTITVTKPRPWYNARHPLDVDDSGGQTPVSPLDLLLVFNFLNANPQGVVVPPDAPIGSPFFYDTSADNHVSPLDALLIVNYLNTAARGTAATTQSAGEGPRAPPGEGENDEAASRPQSDDLDTILALLAHDAAKARRARRLG